MAIQLITLAAAPVFAFDSGTTSASYWDWITSVPSRGGGFTNVSSGSFGQVCSDSPDGLHHSDSLGHSGSYDSNGRYTICTCKHCGDTYKVYASDLQQSYDAQVSELPADNINSAGLSNFYITGWTYRPYSSYVVITSSISDYPYIEGYNTSYSTLDVHAYSGIFSVPVTGSYKIVFPEAEMTKVSNAYDRGKTYLYGGTYSGYLLGNCDNGFEKSLTLVAGVEYYIYSLLVPSSLAGENDFAFYRIYRPYIQGLYSGISGETSAFYNINSRPTSITGDYGIIGDNGQITKVETTNIVNETNNTYTNPATGETNTITDWSYNYSDRSYTLTLEGGTTTTVTYGDENVTIVENTVTEGDTITNSYTVYYLIDASGSEKPGPDVPTTCDHTWTETSRTDSTCTTAGKVSSVCTKCGQTKTEAIPAPGHTWVIRQTVTTEYDDEGNKIQDGYTIFECTVCGEQYKSTDGGAPPGGSGIGSGNSIGVFSGIFGLLVDFLGFFWNTFRDFVGEGVKGFLTALMDGTSSIFGLLNPFNWGG